MQRPRGFTLIELMIVVAVISILAAVALPSYFDSIRKSRRADAIAALNQITQAQERWRSNCPTYAASLTNPIPTVAADACLATKGLGVTATVSSGYYTLAVSGTSGTGYTATATAAGAQVSDTKCTSLTLTMTGGTFSYTAVPAANANRCWNR